MKLISITTDFGPSSRGNGVLIATALKICPGASIIHFADVESFNIKSGARILEGIVYCPMGYHVCVVDPGVGTKRKAIIIKVKRGDYLIGPDNGILLPACEFLGGIEKVREITNKKYMLNPVSPIFHGRDIFMPAAAHLANGIAMEEFGKEVKIKDLAPSPYKNAQTKNNEIGCEVIHINNFGSVFINVLAATMQKFAAIDDKIKMKKGNKEIMALYKLTFGDVGKGNIVIMDDDFGRVEIAVNQGNFADKFKIKTGDKIVLSKAAQN